MSESNLSNLQANFRSETHAYREFDSEIQSKLDDMLQPAKMKDDQGAIQVISSFIVDTIHLKEAPKVIEHIPKSTSANQTKKSRCQR